MIDPVLFEITTACLLRDILKIDARVWGKGKEALFKYYGISAPLLYTFTGENEPGQILPCDHFEHLIRHIDKDYLGLTVTPSLSPLRSSFAGEYNEENAGWFSPCGLCYEKTVYYPEMERTTVPKGYVQEICKKIGDFCRNHYDTSGFLHGLLDRIENFCSYISPDAGAHSLFETAKLRAGIAACTTDTVGHKLQDILRFFQPINILS